MQFSLSSLNSWSYLLFEAVLQNLQGSYLTLGSLRTLSQWQNVGLVAGALALAFGGRWAYTTFTDARKRSKYQRALEEVNKYQ